MNSPHNRNLLITVGALLLIFALPAGFLFEFATAWGNSRYERAGFALGAAMIVLGVSALLYSASFTKPHYSAAGRVIKSTAIASGVFALELIHNPLLTLCLQSV